MLGAERQRLEQAPATGPIAHLDCRTTAALAGVAPFNGDSGQQRGQRHIWGVRAVPAGDPLLKRTPSLAELHRVWYRHSTPSGLTPQEAR